MVSFFYGRGNISVQKVTEREGISLDIYTYVTDQTDLASSAKHTGKCKGALDSENPKYALRVISSSKRFVIELIVELLNTTILRIMGIRPYAVNEPPN